MSKGPMSLEEERIQAEKIRQVQRQLRGLVDDNTASRPADADMAPDRTQAESIFDAPEKPPRPRFDLAAALRALLTMLPRVVRGGLWGWIPGWLVIFCAPLLLSPILGGADELPDDYFTLSFWGVVLGILYLFFSFLLWRHGRGRGREVRWPFRIGIVLGIVVMIYNFISIFG